MNRHPHSLCSRRLLLAGASLLAMFAAHPVLAQVSTSLNPNSSAGGGTSAGGSGGVPQIPTLTPVAESALQRQVQIKARAATAAEIARQAQIAARVAAVRDLSGPVRNGLGLGALNPAVTVRTSAAADPTGMLTWDGADLPTQVANATGGYDVTIKQDQERAILSWDTFNVGKDTNLTFDQKGNKDWIALNRVVGQLDPVTGRRDPTKAPAPSQILGAVKADGGVIVINQNGIIFGGGAQVNTRALIATSLEFGPTARNKVAATLRERNDKFMSLGILGEADAFAQSNPSGALLANFASQGNEDGIAETPLEGGITIEAGAKLTAKDSGLILLMAPTIDNAGHLAATNGQIMLAASRGVTLQRAEGSVASADPFVRGFNFANLSWAPNGFVRNRANAVIESLRGNISLTGGAVVNEGVLWSTTSVSRNGSIYIYGGDTLLAGGSILTIEADTGSETIPQDPQSVLDFKPSVIRISRGGRIEIGNGALVRAPGGNISIGAVAGLESDFNRPAITPDGFSRLFIDSGAVIDAGGVKDVLVPASRNQIQIFPVKKNELANSPDYRDSFLNGATVYIDPRISGVRADGVAWIGSPLIEAGSYYQQVGVKAEELLTAGGSVVIGGANWTGQGNQALAADVIVKAGATIDVSGGWVRYEGGTVRTSQLITKDGRIVDISKADPNDAYLGFAGGFSVSHGRWGVTDYYQGAMFSGAHVSPEYIEGRDAGALTVKGSALALDGTVLGHAYAGAMQRDQAKEGTAKSDIYGDLRVAQGAPSQLPSGAMLMVQMLTSTSSGLFGGGDITIVDAADADPLAADVSYDQHLSFDADGGVVRGTRGTTPLLDAARQETLKLSDSLLSESGLSQVTLRTTGRVTVDANADVSLNPGGVFDVLAGHRIQVDGTVAAASGKIILETFGGQGSIFAPSVAAKGDYDVVVTGTLSTRGLWVNDFGRAPREQLGGAYLDGGSIAIYSAASVATAFAANPTNPTAPKSSIDLSGSIMIADGARIDVSGGGRVREDGSLDLTARGGDLSLINETTYFQLSNSGGAIGNIGAFPSFRINGGTQIAVNPDKINSVVSIADGTILAHGFAGGGTFNLTTPEIALGNAPQDNATVLAPDFFSKTGFGDYNIVSYKTALLPSQLENTLGGYDALLATQTLTVKAGETLSLSQSMLPSVLSSDRMAALRGLASGGDVRTVVSPGIAADAWDRRAVNLKLGGLTELVVEQGGRIEGEAGAELTVARLRNEGSIYLPGGKIRQELVLPLLYANDGSGTRIGVHSLDEVFGPRNANGKYSETANNALGYRAFIGGQTRILANAEFASTRPLYLLGVMGEGAGIELAEGSVTDLSGISIVNPRAALIDRNGSTPIRSGIVYDGGSIESGPRQTAGGTFLRSQLLGSYTNVLPYIAPVRDASEVRVESGATLDLSGAVDVYDQSVNGGGGMLDGRGFEKALVWSNGGSLIAQGGLVLGAGAIIDARGGAPDAATLAAYGPAGSTGGTIGLTDLILVEDGEEGGRNALSAAQFNAAGFNTLATWGSLTANGDIDFTLDSGKGRFFLFGRTYGSLVQFQVLTPDVIDQNYVPTIRSNGGALSIVADYVRFDSGVFGTIGDAARGIENTGSIAFKADMIDVSGSLLIDQSVASASFVATGDIRLAGVQPWQNTLTPSARVAPASQGHIAANGDLNFVAAQVYPTTGSNFLITSNADEGTIRFARASSNTPATPYSAGGALTVQASAIEQDGMLRAPLGTITLGGATALQRNDVTFAPATTSVTLGDGSITSVSAAGLSIPYGTTTDGKEWYFAPGSNDPLSTMPAGAVSLGGNEVSVATGATIDLTGGGDVTAYEFVPGNGGSYDVLDRLNVDAFSGNAGLQYPDGRQVYAIVPGLSNGAAAAYDPVYSDGYADLYSLQGVGKQVWLDTAPGIAAGWYTLLPAKYATLPGGMRVVEMPGAENVAPNTSKRHPDGTVIVSGVFGNGAGADSGRTLFSVMPRDTVLKHSNIQLTSGNKYFADKAAHDGKITPRLGIDAGRLVLNPVNFLNVDGTIKTTAAQGGRGANVDIGGKSIAILSELPADALADGTLRVTAGSLTALNAASLLIGGTRTDNADGTTNLVLTAQTISVANDAAHPLSAPEIILAVDNLTIDTIASSITIADGSVIKATGTASPLSGNLIVNGAAPGSTMVGEGAIVRVANGPERLVVRTRSGNPLAATLSVGKATLQGGSILVDSSGDTLIDRDAALIADNLAIGAGQITFAHDAEGLTGFVVTDGLLDTFANAKHLTLRSANSIDFVAGTYALGDLRLDTRGLKGLGGDVSLTGGDIELSNSFGSGVACTAGGTLACGSGVLNLTSDSLVFGPGAVGVYGFGDGVKLAATGGLFTRGIGSFDAGGADVTIVTPFIGDRAEPVAVNANPVLASFSLATTGALAISKGAGTAPQVEGLPGSALSLSGGSVSISGTQIRATAGSVDIRSAGGVTLSDGAVVAAPAYVKTFGDKADSTDRSAPGGRVRLIALDGDIDLGVGTTISVGGVKGSAGKLELVAGNGTVIFGGTIDGKAPEGGAALVIDTKGAYELAALGTAAGSWGFTRELDIRTRTGDLTLAVGQTLKADAVKLTADGGLLTIAGTIDTSGIDGGDVGLYGRSGVTLAATARVDATAAGYAVDDSRDAKGGDVIIGTDGTGVITLAAGSLIDVSAKRPGERLVRLQRDQGVYYQYAEGDQGGTVTLRAPIVEQAGADTVRVSVGDVGTIKGARAIALEAFKRWDLSEVAASGLYSGVVLNGATGAVTLDVRTGLDTTNADGTTTLVAGLNFLGDRGPGTVVEFAQDFDVSGAYGALGGLASQANFRARAGIDLYNGGDITLASNWNLGAGAINVPAAIAAGLMQDIGGGQSVILGGREAEAFRRFGSLTYRPGRSIAGEAPGVSLLAGGNLRLDGGLTDGFFQFAGLAAPASAIGVLTKGDGNAYPSIFPFEYYWIWDAAYNFGNGMFTYASGPVAYDASLNGAAPSSSGVQSMVPVPVAQLTGLTTSSVSLLLSAGSAGAASVDPERVVAGRAANVLVAALAPADSGGGGGGGPLRYVPLFDASPWDFDDTTDRVGLDDFTARWEELNGEGAPLVVTYGADDGMSMQRMIAEAERFAAALDDGSDAGLTALVDKYGRGSIEQSNPFGGDGQITAPAEVITYLWKNYWSDAFHEDVTEFLVNYGIDPNIVGSAGAGGQVQNVVRTGTGSIRMKASGDVSLFDAVQPVPTYGVAEDRIGAAAVYTVGQQASLAPRSLRDPLTGAPVSVTAPILVSDFAGAYYLTGGGDVSISAGRDVVSRRPAGERAFNHYLAGSVGNATDISVRLASFKHINNSNLLTPLEDGVAAFGGGDVRVDAGRDLIDFTAITAGSAVTTTEGNTLISFGGGNLDIGAGRDILGGRFEIWSGQASLTAGRDIGSAGIIDTQAAPFIFRRTVENRAMLRMFDASFEVSAGRDIALDTVKALSPLNLAFSSPDPLAATRLQNALGFYTGAAALTMTANGGISIARSLLGGGFLDGTVLPGTMRATALTGDLSLSGAGGLEPIGVLLYPDADGQLELFAGGSIGAVNIAMLDADSGAMPGYFTDFSILNASSLSTVGQPFQFPVIYPSSSDTVRAAQHREEALHGDDAHPVRIYAGRDIGTADRGVTLWLPKQGRIGAGRDILNMIYIGQNLAEQDVTRITAGRDIVGTSRIVQPLFICPTCATTFGNDGVPRPAMLGNSFVIGGSGSFQMEAGRDAGPFLNSADVIQAQDAPGSVTPVNQRQVYGGGILSVGNEWNPWLGEQGADVTVMFGVANGVNYDGLRDYYLDPANLGKLDDDLFEQIRISTENVNGVVADRTKPIYAPILIAWLKAHAATELKVVAGSTEPSFEQAYGVFLSLPALRQRALLNQVYFNELKQPSIPDSPSYLQYGRGYSAVNLLFPADWGYTKNEQGGGSNGANAAVLTGDLDLRLATIQTARGGDIAIFGPGGRVLAGSTVRTSDQAARRAYIGGRLFSAAFTLESPNNFGNSRTPYFSGISAIPAGYEGVLTLRGGTISTFTDGDFLLNQSRLFTLQGGDITMWSSNADLNAGQGPKTSSNFPPVVVRIDENAFFEENRVASTTGAGIGAFRPTIDAPAPDVYLMAPRGTVDAGDAGVRVAGSIFVAALQVANADNFQVDGKSFGIPTGPTVDVGANLSASNSAASAAQEVAQAMQQNRRNDRPSIITVTIDGFGLGGEDCDPATSGNCPAR